MEEPDSMRTVHRRAWMARAFGFVALAAPGGCRPADELKPPDERRKEAEATKTPPPPGMKKQEKFDPRKALHEKGPAKESAP
jgi:hypothetical protein